MTAKILCVDDDANILSAYQRQLRKQFQIDIALDGESALAAVARDGPYAVIVSDMRMPGMDGVELLSKVGQQAPETVRMMLTGYSDLQTATQAVNEGHIFRFMTKPCAPETLASALEAGVRQYQLITAERDLLEKTLNGAVSVLTDILAIVDPQSFDRAGTLRDLAQIVSRHMNLDKPWELEMAAMLSQLGLVAVPPGIVSKARAGRTLDGNEQKMLVRVPEVGKELLAKIPRLEAVAEIVLYQNKRFDGSGFPQDAIAGKDIPLKARVLKVLGDLVQAESLEIPRMKTLYLMQCTRHGWYDPDVLNAVNACLGGPIPAQMTANWPTRSVPVSELQAGQLLMSDLQTGDGLLLLSAGHAISAPLLARIQNIAQISKIQEPILVKSPSG